VTMVAATASAEAKKAKKEAEEKAKAEEQERQRIKGDEMFEKLLQRISLMDKIAERTESMCSKMDACEENLKKLERKEWVTFIQMGIVGEGEGDPGTMYEDEKKRKEAEAAAFRAEVLAKAKPLKGRAYSGYKPHQAHRHKKFVSPAKKAATAPPEYTSVYDAETQSCKLVTWDEYLITNKAPPCSNYVTVYNPETEEIDLLFWSQYVNLGLQDEDLAARKKFKAVPEYTTVYDAETQSCKLVLWDKYLISNKAPPCSDYVTVYNPETQEIDLLFWSQYVRMGLHDKDLAARKKI